MSLKELAQILGTFMPVAKIRKNCYLLGTEAKQVKVVGDSLCMVRVGGGYVTLEEYYDHYSLKQCVALFHILATEATTYQETIVELLRSHSVEPSTITSFSRTKDDELWS